MSPLTIFLAKFIGLYCIILALVMMTRKESAVATMKAVVATPPLLLLFELLGLAAGLAMVIGHNIWSGGALPIVVTILGWLFVIRGALLVLSPEQVSRLMVALRYEEGFYFYMGGTLLLGLYLAIAGFTA